jgi:hypothetical protein
MARHRLALRAQRNPEEYDILLASCHGHGSTIIRIGL